MQITGVNDDVMMIRKNKELLPKVICTLQGKTADETIWLLFLFFKMKRSVFSLPVQPTEEGSSEVCTRGSSVE